MKHLIGAILCASATFTACAQQADRTASVEKPVETADTAIVYMTNEISPEAIVKLYKALGRKATGKVAIKISTGEPGGHNFLQPQLIADFLKLTDGTIVECNTAYEGKRFSTEDHRKAAEEHGFTAIAPVDIMDADGETKLPLKGGKHLSYDIVGSHYPDYDFTVILSHFKGHAMGGFGGAVKNMSIGIASSNGKSYIHTAGKIETTDGLWQNIAAQDDFLESMADFARRAATNSAPNGCRRPAWWSIFRATGISRHRSPKGTATPLSANCISTGRPTPHSIPRG